VLYLSLAQGQFSGGRRHGYGVLVVRGNRYEGNWLNGQRHGYGTYTFRNGDSYTGEFRHGKFNGRGRYTFKATGQTIEAIFKVFILSVIQARLAGEIYLYGEG
jgi:hypothetical protein